MTRWMKVKRRLRQLAVREDGTQLVEFSIALPFLLLMFAGSVELGRMFYTYTTLTKSTVVGARYLSAVPIGATGYASSDVSAAKNLMICGVASSCGGLTPIVSGLDASKISVTPPPVSGSVRYVTVTITYGYSPKVFNLAAMTGISSLSLSYTLTPATAMRYLVDSL